MWYDATAAAGSLESAKSPVKGKIGYVPAPVEKTKSSGWLYTWAWGMQKASQNPDKAWKFISWASSKEYEKLVGEKIGWSNVPAGKRASTYANPEYRKEAAAFQDVTPPPSKAPTPRPGRTAPARARHPVRRHPRVHRPRHQGLPGDQRGHRRAAVRRLGPEEVTEARREDRRGVRGTMTATASTTAVAARARRSRRQATAGRLRAWATRAPLLPALIFMVVVTQLPFVATLVISFFDWNALYPDARSFTGLANYSEVLTDPDLRKSVLTTIVLTATVVLASLVIGLGLALLLDRKFRGRGLVRTLLIAPFLLVPVAAALLWKHVLYNPEYGLFNGLLHWVGGDGAAQPDWISNTPLLAVEASLVWQWTPFMMLILLAGLQSRDPELIEAARMDGASNWQVFRHLTLPHLRRYLELGALLGSIYIVQNFDAVFTITSGGLGTANLPYTVYQSFYQAHENGLASAAGVLVVIGSIIIATFALRVVSSLFREEASR